MRIVLATRNSGKVAELRALLADLPVELVSAARLAYVPGAYDSIEDVVTALGNEITEISTEDLTNPDVTSQYGVIFVNCGASGISSNAVVANLRTFVQNGGVIYASDWASTLVEALYPEDIETSRSGRAQDVTATVLEEDVRLFVDGRSEIEIVYDLGNWARVTELGTNATVLVEGVINPLMASIFSNEKTKRITAVHAWWPGGMIIGGLLAVVVVFVFLWNVRSTFIAALAIPTSIIGAFCAPKIAA